MKIIGKTLFALTCLSAVSLIYTQAAAGSWRPPASTWGPMSNTAASITGAIKITDDRLSFENGKSIGLVLVDKNSAQHTDLYRVESGANPELFNGNYLCDERKSLDFIYVEAQDGGKSLTLTMINSSEPLTLASLGYSAQSGMPKGVCATYGYMPGRD